MLPSQAGLLVDANDLLRSAYQITLREGRETNWDGFKAQLERVLVEQSKVLNGTAHVDAATCTPKTFRMIPDPIPDQSGPLP